MTDDGISKRPRRKIISRSLVAASILMLAIGSIILSKQVLTKHVVPEYSDDQRPIKSFIFIKRTSQLEFIACAPILEEGVKKCALLQEDKDFQDEITDFFNQVFSYSIRGSSALVGHDPARDMSYILSAYHVCDDFEPRTMIMRTQANDHMLIYRYTPLLKVTDFYGNTYDAEMVRGDINNDLCLLGSSEMMGHIEPIRIAQSEPTEGDRIFNIASPHSLSQPGAILSYEGYHGGKLPAGRLIKDGHYLNAIPTAPGSSGSPVLNEDGEIISVVSYGFTQRQRSNVPGVFTIGMWPNASGGPSLIAIHRLLKTRKIQ